MSFFWPIIKYQSKSCSSNNSREDSISIYCQEVSEEKGCFTTKASLEHNWGNHKQKESMRFKLDNVQKSSFVVVILKNAANYDSNENRGNRFWKNLKSLNLIIRIKNEDTYKGNKYQKNESKLHVFFFFMMLLNVFHVFTIMLWIQILIFTKALSWAMYSVVANSILSANLKICRISRTRETFWSKKSNRALSTCWACKVLFTYADVLWNILMFRFSWSRRNILHSSLAVSVIVTFIIA